MAATTAAELSPFAVTQLIAGVDYYLCYELPADEPAIVEAKP